MMRVVTAMLVVMVMMVGLARGKEKVVEIKAGRVSGVVEQTVTGHDFWAYRGIPFAEPPVGPLRFQPPVASKGWEGVRDGSSNPPKCLQPDYFGNKEAREMLGSEDCLYLNVFTPLDAKSGTKTDLPVMVFIHGGAFHVGSALDYGPKVLLDHDVILVVLQYRLGIMGFLSTEDEVIPGNFGLLDQAAGLRWVHDNIRQFGGDPARVTIFGESAGSASSHYHLLSPLSKGLFSQAILQSGTTLNPCTRGGSFKRVAEQVGRDLGCSDPARSSALLACLREAPAKVLAGFIHDITKFSFMPVLLGPRVDGVFLKEDPYVLLKEGRQHHYPIMGGVTAHEGGFVTAELYGKDSLVEQLTESSEMQLAALELRDGDVAPLDTASRAFKHYMGGPHFGVEHDEAVTQMIGDRLFNVGMDIVLSLHARTTPTYAYELTHRGQHSFADVLSGYKLQKHWVAHADDLLYLFAGSGMNEYFPLSTPEDLRLRDIMAQLWVNFATTGNPTPDQSLGFTWTPLDPSAPHHLDLTPNNPTMAPNHRQEVNEFWSTLPLKENLVLAPEKVVYEGSHRVEL